MKKYFIFIIFVFLFSNIAFADTTNTGFIPGTIWYSQEPLVEGSTVSIFTAVWNGDANPLSARVEFYDKNVILGFRDIVVSAQSLKDVSISWRVTSGDHVISAKIVSSKITDAGKTESVILVRRDTGENKQFVPKVLKTIDGVPVSSSTVIENEINQAGSKIGAVLPDSVNAPLSNSIKSIDVFRNKTLADINVLKNKTQKDIDALNKIKTPVVSGASGIEGTQKPIAYIKLFFFTVAVFLFTNTLTFYGLGIVLCFLILRFIYRKIRNR